MLVYALCARPQRARRPRARSPRRCSTSRRAPSCAPTRRTPTPCPSTRCSTRSSRATSRTTCRRGARGRGPRSRHGAAASRSSSTATSTSAARRRPGCGCRRRRSARTAACRSPTAGPADAPAPTPGPRSDAQARVHRTRLAEGALLARGAALRDHLPDRPRRARRHHPFGYLVGRFGLATLLLAPVTIGALRARGPERRMLVHAGLVAGLLMFGGYVTQTIGLEYTSPSISAFITGLYVVITPVIESVIVRRLPRPPVMAGVAARHRRAVPAHRRRRVARQGRAVHPRLRGVLRVPHRVPRRVHEPACRPCRSPRCRSAWSRSSRCRPPRCRAPATLTITAVVAVVFTGVMCSVVALPLQLFGQRRHQRESCRARAAGRAGVRRHRGLRSTASTSTPCRCVGAVVILAGHRGVGAVAAAGHSYTGCVTPEELANLARLRRARDLIDREYSRDARRRRPRARSGDVDAPTSRGSSAPRTARRRTRT